MTWVFLVPNRQTHSRERRRTTASFLIIYGLLRFYIGIIMFLLVKMPTPIAYVGGSPYKWAAAGFLIILGLFRFYIEINKILPVKMETLVAYVGGLTVSNSPTGCHKLLTK
jgi:hypothetical protein